MFATLIAICCCGNACAETKSAIAPSSPPCSVSPLDHWTPQEKWVWSRVCEGSVANLAEQYGGATNPLDSQEWPAERILRSRFLETVLLRERFRSELGTKGLRLRGARVEDRLDLNGADIKSEVRIDELVLEQGVDFEHARIGKRITFDRTISKGVMSFEGLSVDQDFSASGGSFTAIDLKHAKIGANLSLQGTKIFETLDMDGLRVGGQLLMRSKAEFGDVVLRGAKIERQLELVGVRISGMLDMSGLQADALIVRENNQLTDVVLRSAKIARQFELMDARISGVLDMSGLQADALFVREYNRLADVVMRSAVIERQMVVGDTTVFGTLDMSSLRVGGGLFYTRQIGVCRRNAARGENWWPT